MKRIGLVITTRQLTSLGGIGYFVSSLVELLNQEYVFDIIVDRPIKSVNDIPFDNLRLLDIIWSEDAIPYSKSSKIDIFNKTKIPLEVSVNFYYSIAETFRSKKYDFILINSVDAVPGVLQSGIQDLCPTFLFTHDAGYFDSGNPVKEYSPALACVNDIQIISQREFDIKKGYHYLPMPNRDILISKLPSGNTEPDTAYYCGTYSARKNPQDFVEFCRKYNKKPLVLTNKKGHDYFVKAFDDLGIDHDIRYNLFGQEKMDFISRAELCFFPSDKEYFPYGVLEALLFMPVICYDRPWSRAFPQDVLNMVKGIECPKSLKLSDWVYPYFDARFQRNQWIDFIDRQGKAFKDSKTTSKNLDTIKSIIVTDKGISISDVYKDVVKRDVVALADATVLYKICDTLGVENNSTDTYIGKIVKKESGLKGFFL